jgi:hypothetical protein
MRYHRAFRTRAALVVAFAITGAMLAAPAPAFAQATVTAGHVAHDATRAKPGTRKHTRARAAVPTAMPVQEARVRPGTARAHGVPVAGKPAKPAQTFPRVPVTGWQGPLVTSTKVTVRHIAAGKLAAAASAPWASCPDYFLIGSRGSGQLGPGATGDNNNGLGQEIQTFNETLETDLEGAGQTYGFEANPCPDRLTASCG